MKAKDYIRKAVELADGIEVTDENRGHDGFWLRLHGYRLEFHSSWPWVLDAIRAQLERQVDAIEWDADESLGVETYPASSVMFRYQPRLSNSEPIAVAIGHGRTMNTIRAIVDSKVLDR